MSNPEQIAAAIRVERGAPTDHDLAALVAVLTAAAASEPVATQGSSRPPELWGLPVAMHRASVPYSPFSFGHLSASHD